MFDRLGQFVSRHWIAVIIAWVVVLVSAKLLAPPWDSVTQDGDIAYLPDHLPSIRGEQLLAEAFPDNRARSQVVLVVERDQKRLNEGLYRTSWDDILYTS